MHILLKSHSPTTVGLYLSTFNGPTTLRHHTDPRMFFFSIFNTPSGKSVNAPHDSTFLLCRLTHALLSVIPPAKRQGINHYTSTVQTSTHAHIQMPECVRPINGEYPHASEQNVDPHTSVGLQREFRQRRCDVRNATCDAAVTQARKHSYRAKLTK